MQIDATYDSGTLILPSIRLKHSRFQVQVIIPDDEILDATSDLPAQSQSPSAGPAAGSAIVTEIKEILGPWREKLQNIQSLTKQETRELRCDEWEDKRRGST
jgi:hypothetical protein